MREQSGIVTTLDWPDCRNARDVGGLRTIDGRRVGFAALLRSDNHDRLTAAGVDLVRSFGISRILDLRAGWECDNFPSPFANDAVYLNVPLTDPAHQDDTTVQDTYLRLIDNGRGAVGAAVAAIADAPAGPVLVHCHAGKDRTGILVALALTASGVEPADVAGDYALSPDSEPRHIMRLLDHLTREYGGAAEYLREAGVTAIALRALQERLLAAESRGSR